MTFVAIGALRVNRNLDILHVFNLLPSPNTVALSGKLYLCVTIYHFI